MSFTFREYHMHSSRQWSSGTYIRFSGESVSRECKIPFAQLEDYQAFLVSTNKLELGGVELEGANAYVYPLHLDEINRLLTKLNSPLSQDFWKPKSSIRIGGREKKVDLPAVMTILNMTPDSFYPGSRATEDDLGIRLDEIESAGGNLVDIGGQSTRPGSDGITPEEEMKRIAKAVEISLNRRFTVSIDSYSPKVLRECLEMGAHLINDVTGLEDPEIGRLAKRYDIPLVIVHKKGDFKSMQRSPSYENVVNEIISFFMQKISVATDLGIGDDIILDPGIGFGKRVEDNLSIINNLRDLKLGHPLLIGLSRKNFIGQIMSESVEERGISSLILNSIAIARGADIVRVHDVKENMKLVKIIKKLREPYM